VRCCHYCGARFLRPVRAILGRPEQLRNRALKSRFLFLTYNSRIRDPETPQVNISARARARATIRGDDVGRFYCEQSAEDKGPSSDGNTKSLRREHASSVERLYIFRQRFDRLSTDGLRQRRFRKAIKLPDRAWNQRRNFRSRSVKGEIERASRSRQAMRYPACILSRHLRNITARARDFLWGFPCSGARSTPHGTRLPRDASFIRRMNRCDSSDLHLIEIRGARKVRGDCTVRHAGVFNRAINPRRGLNVSRRVEARSGCPVLSYTELVNPRARSEGDEAKFNLQSA